jgi:ketosteroid isomerase-like protein
MHRSLLRLFACFALCAAATLPAQAATCAPNDGSAGRIIQQRLNHAVELLKKGEAAAAVSDLFLPDAVYVTPGGTLHGIAAITARFQALPGRLVDGGIVSTSVTVDCTTAYEYGTNSLTLLLPNGSKVTSNGRYLTAWRYGADGVWRIAVDAPMTDPEPKK